MTTEQDNKHNNNNNNNKQANWQPTKLQLFAFVVVAFPKELREARLTNLWHSNLN